MIKPEQVPKKVVRAAEKAWEKDEESFRPNAKTIAAALNAWPGVNTDAVRCGTLILHLPKEPHNDEA